MSGSYSSYPPNEFVNYRGMRMNYMAVTGLLARVHHYKGDYQKSYQYATEILDKSFIGCSSLSEMGIGSHNKLTIL